MKTDNVETSAQSPKGGALKKLKWILIGSAGFCLLIFFGAPVYLSSAGGTNMLLGKINAAVDGEVNMDDFSMGWFKGIELTNLSYDDSETSVKVQRVRTHPKYASLLGGKVKLGHTVVEGPRVHFKVLPEEQGVRSRPRAVSQAPAAAEPSADFSIEQVDLEVIDGAATIELGGDASQTVRFFNIASKVQVAGAGEPATLDVSMDVDETSSISAKGSVDMPKSGWTLTDGDFTVQVSRLELASLKPLFAMAGQDMDMAGQLNADATMQIADGKLGQLKAEATIDDFAQGTGDQRVAFEKPVTFSALTTGMGEAMTIESFEIDSDFCDVSCSGTLQALDYEVDADLAQTMHFADQFADLQGYGAAGTLKAKGSVKLTDEKVGVVTAASVRQLVVKKDDLQTPATDATLNVKGAMDKANNQFQLASLDLTATPGTVNITNLVMPLSSEAAKTLSMDAKANLDLGKTWPFVQILADVPADLELAGVLDSTVKVSTQASQVRLITEKTQISQLKITRDGVEPYIQDVLSMSGDIVLDMEKQTYGFNEFVIKDSQNALIEGKGEMAKTVSGLNTHLKGDFEAAYDLKTVSAFGAAFIPEGLTLEGKRSDSLHFESVYPTAQPELMTQNLNAAATVGFDKAAYNGLNFGKTDVKLNVTKGVAEFAIPEAVVNDGKFQFAGSVDLNEEVRTLRLKEPMRILDNIHITEELTQTMLKYLSPAFAQQSNISGFASLSCQQLEIPFDADDKNNIVIDGTVQIDKMRLKAIGAVGDILERTDNRSVFDATLLPSRFLLKDGIMRYDEMEFHFDQYPIGFFGKIYLDKRLDMEVLVPYRFDLERLDFSSIKVGQQLSDRLSLPVDGTVDKPKVRLEKMFESILEKNQGDLIRRGLEELFG